MGFFIHPPARVRVPPDRPARWLAAAPQLHNCVAWALLGVSPVCKIRLRVKYWRAYLTHICKIMRRGGPRDGDVYKYLN